MLPFFQPNMRRLYRPDIAATLKISVPIIIAQLGTVLMGVADNIQVGKLGAAPIAAAGIANSVYFLIAIIGMGTLSVIAPQVAAAYGKDDKQECSYLLRTGVRLGLFFGVGLCLVIVLLSYNFHWFRQTPEVEALAVEYLQIIGMSVIPMLFFLAIKQFSDGLSYTRVAMVITLIGLVLNVFFNWVFIFGKLGMPAWGLNGAGFATLLVRIFMAIAMLVYIFRAPMFRAFTQPPPADYSYLPLIRRILKLGLPGGFQLFFEVAAFSGAAIIAGWLGTVPLAAHQIAINLASVTYMVAAGIGAAGGIRVGQAFGIGSQPKIVRAGTVSLTLAVIFMSLTCILFLSLNYFLVRLYIQDIEVVSLAASLVIIGGFFQLSDGVQVVGLGILRGIEDVNVPTVIALVAYWVIGLPLGYILAFTFHMNVQGIWIGLLAGLTVSAVLLTFRFYKLSSGVKSAKPEKSLIG
ncbi:MATE family efflux transporter [Rhodocytophaga aerolata]|uniref:Multidrug-efflux transporter n=1 Tax=Rhodocytophaga aerolata TaxID=455078 RepID=A0ABT8R1W2_9BACT|nr:MATE family efflux transporter [Rhodocytophaga aerolata]MDO1445298.1 MATE family efflux transporter [Rhodocytophaga aerolata]